MTTWLKVSSILVLTLHLFTVPVTLSQTCPLPPKDAARQCRSINSWDDLANVVRMTRSTENKILCPFDIQMPDDALALIFKETITLMCAEAGRCSIRAATNQDEGIMKMRGMARVTLFGFVFSSNGSISDRSSAVHITYRTAMTQTFCNCVFDGFKGKIRGVAFRSEYKTKVNLVGCTFKNNRSNDLGAIFNRGSMNVTGCDFKNNSGRGGAIGSSKGSLTILKGNSFHDNREGVSVFFHRDEDFVDAGGNVAIHNDSCDGIFVLNGSQCLPFKLDLPKSTNSPTSDPFGDQSTCQRFETKGISSCISIASFDQLKKHVEYSQGTLIFCPFIVKKSPFERLDVKVRVRIICLVEGKCEIIGGGKHVRIMGHSAQVFLQGFVFKQATISAVHILSGSPLSQCLLGCHFNRNLGDGRGVSLLAGHNTKVQINSCHFKRNKSFDIGGSVFNRGEMEIVDSLFEQNQGMGNAVGNAPTASLTMKNNTFRRNTNGHSVFIHDKSFVDLGGNVGEENSDCDGVWIDRSCRSCIPFLPPSAPTASPVTSSLNSTMDEETTNAPIGGIGYFNYNNSDPIYGPSDGWGSVRDNPELLRYEELLPTLRRSLINKCNWNNVRQSPIDLCENKINNDCHEYHQTRSHSGNINLGDEQVTAQILPSKLRLKYYPDRPPTEGPYPPELDFAHNWNGYAEVNHVDIKIPSEHTICGERYPAEFSIYVLHPGRQQTIVMSILLTYHENDEDNEHLQLAIDEWQKVYDRNSFKCSNTNRLKRNLGPEGGLHEQMLNNTTRRESANKAERDLVSDETPFGVGGWDPFHPSLERSIYHWGYYGSLTEPPCSTFVAWRVLTEPAFISQRQLNQMKNILFTNRDHDSCNYTSVDFEESVARPIQPNRGRLIHKCTAEDYVSDEEKTRMKKKTGNPNWCC